VSHKTRKGLTSLDLFPPIPPFLLPFSFNFHVQHKVFPEWFPLGPDEVMVASDIWIYEGTDPTNSRFSTPERNGGSVYSYGAGQTPNGHSKKQDNAISRGWWPYRKGKKQYQPHPIASKELPLP
jgi:hypothetical protein